MKDAFDAADRIKSPSQLCQYTDDPKTLSTVEFRVNLGEVLGEAFFRSNVTHVTRNGKPFAAVVNCDDAVLLQVMRDQGLKPQDVLKVLQSMPQASRI